MDTKSKIKYDEYDDPLERYRALFGDDLIPLMSIQGNEILCDRFHGNPFEVYAYCNEHGKTWREVLEVTTDFDKVDPLIKY